MKNLLARFEGHLYQKKFFKPKDRILIACSGGPDSVALLHLLKELSLKNKWRMGLLHFNHQLRPVAAKKDELFVKNLSSKFKMPFHCGSGDVHCEARKTKTSIEECARKMRYDFFLETARDHKFKKIVFAHTRDDQAETVLMRLFQGTGLRGLSGIREKNKMNGILLIRPLLVFTKKELLQGLTEAGIRYCLDQSNESLQFVRNRIRLKLMPRLRRQFNPRIVEALSRLASIAGEENTLLDELEQKAWRQVFKRANSKKVELRRAALMKLPSPLQFRILERALKKLHARSGLSFEAWQRLRREIERERYRCSLPKDIDLALTSNTVMIFKKKWPVSFSH